MIEALLGLKKSYMLPTFLCSTWRLTKTANTYINSLTGLTDYLANNLGAQNINPLCEASSFDQRLNYAAWFRRNQHGFLGHIKHQGVSNTITDARNIRGRRAIVSVHDDVIGFPERLFENFYRFGMGGAKDERVSVRNQLILLMMNFSECRESDCLHLWVQGVYVDPTNSVIVRLYHPEKGRAPDDWLGRNGVTKMGGIYIYKPGYLTAIEKVIKLSNR